MTRGRSRGMGKKLKTREEVDDWGKVLVRVRFLVKARNNDWDSVRQ